MIIFMFWLGTIKVPAFHWRSRRLIFLSALSCLYINVWTERSLNSPEQSLCRGGEGVGGERRQQQRQRWRPKQGYFYEVHNKDMEMKYLYTAGPSFLALSLTWQPPLLFLLHSSHGEWGEKAEMNESNNLMSGKRGREREGHDGINIGAKACSSIFTIAHGS